MIQLVKMREIYLFWCILCFNYASSVADQCQGLFSPTGQVLLDENTNYTTIDGPSDSYVAILIDPSFIQLGNDTTLVIYDVGTDTQLASFDQHEININSSLIICSFTHQVSINLTGDAFSGFANISYATYSESSQLFSLDDPYSDLIESNGDDHCIQVNFRKTWSVSAADGNVIHYYLTNLTLDDSMGDYLAIGTGDKLFAEAPSMMISGKRTNYKPIDVYGNISYVHLFSKYYTADLGFSLFYNTSLYVPPTVVPPTTVRPPATLNTTVTYNQDTDNMDQLLANFTKTIDRYATLTCEGGKKEKNDVNLTAIITEWVIIEPCLVIVYHVEIYSGSCQGNNSFTLDSYNQMMSNFSSNINQMFGRTLRSSCPSNNLMWIISTVVIMVVAIIISLFVALNRKDYLYKKLQQNDGPSAVSEGHLIHATQFDTNIIDNSNDNLQMNGGNDLGIKLRLASRSHINPAFQDDDDDFRQVSLRSSSSAFQEQPHVESNLDVRKLSERPISFEAKMQPSRIINSPDEHIYEPLQPRN